MHQPSESHRIFMAMVKGSLVISVFILLFVALFRSSLWKEFPPLPVSAANNDHPANDSSTPLQPTQTYIPLPTLTSTPSPSFTPIPTHTPRPTHTPSPSPTPTLAPPSGANPPTVTPYADGLAPKPAPLLDFPSGTINIVLLGSDKRPGDSQWRTDVVIVTSINPNIPSITMLSIPRDTWMYIPGWGFQRINMADVHGTLAEFPGGGAGLIKQTIQYNTGVHVDYYARVDFAGFMKIVDTLGGVDVVANCPLYDVFPDDPITEDPSITGTISIQTPGVHHLDGKHALWYARSRYTSPGGDLDRSRRQHRVLRGIWNKATQFDVLAKLPQVWDELSSSIETDLEWNDMVWLASLAPRLDNSHIRSGFIDGAALRSWVTPSGAAVYVPDIERMLEQVRETFNPPSNIATQTLVKVEVRNGSPYLDWDILATDRLQWEGYLVTSLGPANSSDYTHTQIVDFTTTPKGSRLPALMTLFQVSQENVISQPDPNSPAAYQIIVGEDYIPCVRPILPAPPLPTPTPVQ